jgi:aspartyl-tRNA(Asn)/glutamyl-tRNA(Gln) amidotransferase subunit A
MDFRQHTVAELAAAVRSGARPAVEMTEAALERIASLNGTINAFVAVDEDRALAAAAVLDERIAAGEDVGPLAGMPIGVKDLEDAEGFVTTSGSAVHAGDSPATRDSLLVERLKAAGCVVVGKTNTPEFGFKGDTTNPVFGATRNPWNTDRSPGGSSGGSGAALASGMVPLATGSDGGGSIRIPGSLCGLSTFKASLGRIPNRTAPGWLHLSVSGPMTLRTRDGALALDAVVGPDPGDPTSLPAPARPWIDGVDAASLPDRVAWSPALGYGTVDAEIARVCAAAVDTLADAGVEVVEVDPVIDGDPGLDWARIAGLCNLRSLDDVAGTERWELVDAELRALIDLVQELTDPVTLIKAIDRGFELHQQVARALEGVDVLLSPTVAGQTGLAGEYGTLDGEPDGSWVQFTYPFNMTGNPAGTVMAGLTGDGMPVGLQVIGSHLADAEVLAAMAGFESALGIEELASVD